MCVYIYTYMHIGLTLRHPAHPHTYTNRFLISRCQNTGFSPLCYFCLSFFRPVGMCHTSSPNHPLPTHLTRSLSLTHTPPPFVVRARASLISAIYAHLSLSPFAWVTPSYRVSLSTPLDTHTHTHHPNPLLLLLSQSTGLARLWYLCASLPEPSRVGHAFIPSVSLYPT